MKRGGSEHSAERLRGGKETAEGEWYRRAEMFLAKLKREGRKIIRRDPQTQDS